MSNKFLTSGGDINLANGSQTLFGATIGAVNLNPSTPLKTNSVRELVSEKLDIADVNNLTDDLKIKQNLSFVKDDIQINPETNQIKIYAKTDGNLYKLDSAGTETAIGGGGGDKTVETFIQQLGSTPADFGKYNLYAKSDGFYQRGVTGAEVKLADSGVDFATGSFLQENGIVFRNGTDADKIKNTDNFKLVEVLGTKILSVPDIQLTSTNAVFSVGESIVANTSKLTKITYDPVSTITTIDGDLDVDKIKNTDGTAEVELNTDGRIDMIGDGRVRIRANGAVPVQDSLWLESDTHAYITTTKGIYLNAFEPDNTTPNLTLNTVNGILTIQAINGEIHNTTKGLIKLENIPANPITQLNGFIFNPDAIRVDFNKLDVSKGYLGLDANENLQLHSTTDNLNLQASSNVDIVSQNADITFIANDNVLCYNTPSTDNCVVNKSYLEANTQQKPAVYYLGATTDYNPATAPIHTINHIEGGVATFLNIGWNGSSSGGYLQVRLSAKYPASYATTSTVEGTATVTNQYKYLPLNPTTANSYTINSNYIDDGAFATCMISPIQTAQTPPIAPTRPVIKITIHNLENATTFGVNSGYVMIIEQF